MLKEIRKYSIHFCVILGVGYTFAYNGVSFIDNGIRTRQDFMNEYFLKELNMGISAPTDWMNETRTNHNCDWRWRAQYFCGGVAHELTDEEHHGWEEVFLRPWNKWENPDSIPGMWGRRRIEEAINNNFLLWITNYNISQSYPAHYSPNPAEAVKINIKEKETMLAYFKQFKLLMQIVAEYPNYPFIIHVEPDEWGHMLISVPGDDLDPAAVFVQVGNTGMDEIKDLPDDVEGYARSIKKLRDVYAPNNALLCVSPSPWDWQGRLSAQNWYDMFEKCGILEWDLAVCETGSADIGWSGQDPPYDSTTGMAGGIDNVITWATELHNLSGLPFVLWQVPIGNTYFRTCNNTDYHFCHNSAQLLLENYPDNKRLQRFADGGGIGLIFSAGQGNSTHAHDDAEDGITNPDPIPGTEGHMSEYSDDDGGYIRLRMSTYFDDPIIFPTAIQPDNYMKGKTLYTFGNKISSDLTVKIYSLNGRVIRTIYYVGNGKTTQDITKWDEKDELGQRVANGMYYIILKYGDYNTFKKIVVIK